MHNTSPARVCVSVWAIAPSTLLNWKQKYECIICARRCMKYLHIPTSTNYYCALLNKPSLLLYSDSLKTETATTAIIFISQQLPRALSEQDQWEAFYCITNSLLVCTPYSNSMSAESPANLRIEKEGNLRERILHAASVLMSLVLTLS